MPLPPTLPLPAGLALPSVGLGTFRLRGADASGAVAAALEAGYRHIDTASIYKNEGEVAAGIAASGVPRREVFVTSKVSPYQQGEAAATAACKASLAALGRPIDLMLVHWPGVARQDAAAPGNADARRQTWRVLERYHREGAFRAIGVSNYEVRHLAELLSYAEVAPAVNQVECHPRWQQRELRAFCSDHSIAVVAYCSLGSGALLQDPTVQAVAASTGVTPAQALLLWGLRRGCAVIPKSADPRRIADVSPARLAQLWDRLTDDHLAALDALEAEQGQCKYAWDPSGIA
ncbi:glyoxal reductase-like [Micractinium conductrix]|uniref:Glyoxal reductase-like n=1 Tax=Micractinium conductrix TaxID=554055 RepID=A0A2P6VL53_9CHLO|nr:glyoxal reductase-like [Micractinium conductrix]|eukprot:PSC74818.1 glyoxal reductase-like [Micractinium conductrix]